MIAATVRSVDLRGLGAAPSTTDHLPGLVTGALGRASMKLWQSRAFSTFVKLACAKIFHIPLALAKRHRLGMKYRQPASGIGVLAGLAALSIVACGSEPTDSSTPSLIFNGPAAQTVTSTSGQLTIDLRWSPDVPLRGNDAAQLTFLDLAGNPVDGLDVSIVPWMPAHGHGTAVQPMIMTTAPGVQVATPVYLFMSGEWQLRMTLTGAMDDTAIATVEIP